MKKKIFILLFTTILIACYTTLALEFLAINQIMPFIENNNIATIIIVTIILLFLLFGFYSGSKNNFKNGNIRDKIIKNFIFAAIFISLGTTYSFLHYYFLIFDYIGINHVIMQAIVFSILFLSIPSYLLAQNTHLLANYIIKNTSEKNSIKVLFYSMILAFTLSTITTLFLLPLFGINYAIFFNIFLVIVAILILNKRNRIEIYIACFLFLIITFMLNNTIIDKKLKILITNDTIAVEELSK